MAGIFKYTQLNPVIFGNGAIGCVGEELEKLGCKKLLFVCGPNVTKAGGTIKAAWDLVKKFNPKKCYMNFIIELVHENLNGRENVGPGIDITTLIQI